MSKKDYIAVAHAFSDALKATSSTVDETAHFYALRVVADRLCTIFRNDNPRFNRERFLTACGLVEG